MAIKTKEKILQAALGLFNKKGICNTTLQNIADKTGISVGNLAYHFKNQPEIIAAFNEDLRDDLTSALALYRNDPSILDLYEQLQYLLKVQETYKYAFANVLEIQSNFPETFEIINRFNSRLRQQIKSRIDYHIEKHNLVPMSIKSVESLTDNLLHLIISAQILISIKAVTDLKQMAQHIMSPIEPYLSDEGQSEWKLIPFAEFI